MASDPTQKPLKTEAEQQRRALRSPSVPITSRKPTPIVTVFGSCRVYTPCTILQKRGLIAMNQQNIFGYTHYTSEIIQQINILTGILKPPSRLLPFLNIAPNWSFPAPGKIDDFCENFRETDLFVVEVSSIRELTFKAFVLQINRSRELLGVDDGPQNNWWKHLTRSGVNNFSLFDESKATPLQTEIAKGLIVREQNEKDIIRDLAKLLDILRRPTLLVSHFDTDYNGNIIHQRNIVARALRKFVDGQDTAGFFDPTDLVLDAGITASLQDLGHYRTDFEDRVADSIGHMIGVV